MNEVLNRIADIIVQLQEGDWNNNDIITIINAQGNLAKYFYNINEMLAHRRKAMDVAELHAKQVESRGFLEYKKMGWTDGKASMQAKADAKKAREDAIKAKADYNDIDGVAKAVDKMITACQVSIKNIQKERSTTFMDKT